MAEMRKQLYELIVYSWGKDAWGELVQMEKDIRAERKRQIHERAEFRQKVSDFIFVCIGSIAIIALICYIMILWPFYLLTKKRENEN